MTFCDDPIVSGGWIAEETDAANPTYILSASTVSLFSSSKNIAHMQFVFSMALLTHFTEGFMRLRQLGPPDGWDSWGTKLSQSHQAFCEVSQQ
jgi:hypothetical protein